MKVSAINYLVDAGPLIGFLDRDDQWHEWSRETLTVLDGQLATTETAVAEACHILRNMLPALQELMAMIAEGRVLLRPVLSEHPLRVAELLAKYPLMDTGDATLVVLSELAVRRRTGSEKISPKLERDSLNVPFSRRRGLCPSALIFGEIEIND